MAITWPATPGEALEFLLDGNRRFADGRPAHPNQDAARRADCVAGQHPFAVLIGCSDSRVCPEIIFDRGIGDLFVVRTAGHLLGDEVLASIEYGVTVLGAPLVAILSHERCGAVAAALNAHLHSTTPPGHLRHIVDRLSPDVLAARARGISEPEPITRTHAESTARRLLQQSPPIQQQVEAGACAVAVLSYRLAGGRTELLGQHGPALAAAE
jgi:carbonic anhydrase